MKAIAFGAAGFLLGFLPLPVEAREEQVVGNCTTFVEGGTLFVIGNEIANVIGIVGTDVGVQVTCDGVSTTLDRTTTAVTVQAGDGDDQISTDNSNGLLGGITISVFGQSGNDQWHWMYSILPFLEQDSLYDGGPGDDRLAVVTFSRGDRFDLRRGAAADAVEVQVADIATRMVTGNIVGSAVEVLSVKMGAGDDIMNVTGGLPTLVSLFGEEGDDEMVLTEVLSEIFPSGLSLLSFVGGTGHDKFTYKGTGASEHYVFAGVRDLTIPDPELRVAHIATGLQLAHVQFLHVEDVTLDASGGDDVVDVQWDAALMSDWSLVQVDLGKGNNTMSVNLLPVLTMPETEGVQTARFDVVGSGTDQVTFNHSAGNWFDVFFRADLGKGNDAFRAELLPPPDDGLPEPEGVRSLQFDVATGSGNDFVAIHNRTTDDSSLSADLGRGDDIFEATGIIGLRLLPGPGSDTARITRNLLQFVTEFESVEILE